VPSAFAANNTMRYTRLMAKKTTLEEVGQMLEHVVKHMATKEDLNDVRSVLGGQIGSLQEQVNSIETQLRAGRHETRIGDLEEKVFGAARF